MTFCLFDFISKKDECLALGVNICGSFCVECDSVNIVQINKSKEREREREREKEREKKEKKFAFQY